MRRGIRPSAIAETSSVPECTTFAEGPTAANEIKLQIQPKVTFSQGKAVKASLNWGKIEAPKIAETAFVVCDGGGQRPRVLQSIVAHDSNEFMRCMELKQE